MNYKDIIERCIATFLQAGIAAVITYLSNIQGAESQLAFIAVISALLSIVKNIVAQKVNKI